MERRTGAIVLLTSAVVVVAIVVVAVLLTNGGPSPTGTSGSSSTQTTSAPPRSTTAPAPSSTTVPTAAHSASAVTCTDDATADTLALSNAIATAESMGGTVTIASGTCALDAPMHVTASVTIEGSGATATSLVQHARKPIFSITADGVTVEELNLDTATYNSTTPQLHNKNPDPLALVSNGNRTTVRNINFETGSGFGIRFVGPQPCSSDQRTGDVISGVNATTTGKGGFASVDVDCQNGATLNDITIHGGILALYQDQNVTLNGETFTPGPSALTCVEPWFVTGPSLNISIDDVTSAGGPGKITVTAGAKELRAGSFAASTVQASQHISVTNQNITNTACTGLAR